jgi:ArsR family transcriptional regulator
MHESSEFFKTLSDPNRVKILQALRDREKCVSEIVEEVGLKQPVVSHHLGVLRRLGLVNARKNGKQVHYSLCCACLADMAQNFFSQFEIQVRQPPPPRHVRRSTKGRKPLQAQ